MTFRAVIVGMLLGLGISASWYFNDYIMQQTYLVGNLLPLSIFGLAVILALIINPLLAPVGKRWMFSGREIAIIAALGLAVCGWAGSGYLRYFATNLVMPNYWERTKPAWQSMEVMSYVPGGSHRLGEGHIQDWPGLLTKIDQARLADQSSVGKRIWERLPRELQKVTSEGAASGRVQAQDRQRLVRALNEIVSWPDFFDPGAFAGVELPAQIQSLAQADKKILSLDELQGLNRELLVAAFPKHFLPRPEGEGVLMLGGRADPEVVESLVQGWQANQMQPITRVPWSAWWPSIRLWGGFALLCGLAALCLALVVHPQWARRELLAYPVARFVDEITQRRDGALLPEIARTKLFWIAVGLMLLLHTLNGLRAWFPENFIYIPHQV
ncbi:MAG: hypothetical protein HC898_11360 [Phycisphaerales bacterium]|nr:hypothetical protein [Phycisphaerales bacterium]